MAPAQFRAAMGNPSAPTDAADRSAEDEIIGSEDQDVVAEFRPERRNQLCQQARMRSWHLIRADGLPGRGSILSYGPPMLPKCNGVVWWSYLGS